MSTFPTSGAYGGIPIPVAPQGVDPVPVRRASSTQETALENNYTATGRKEPEIQEYKPESVRKRERAEKLDRDTDPFEQEEMKKAMDILQEVAERMGRRLRFEKDEEAEKLVVKIIDTITGEVIRQVPPEEVLEMARKLKELGRGWVDLVR